MRDFINLITETMMSRADALRVFRQNGVQALNMDPAQIRKAEGNLMLALARAGESHDELGDESFEAQDIHDAAEVLAPDAEMREHGGSPEDGFMGHPGEGEGLPALETVKGIKALFKKIAPYGALYSVHAFDGDRFTSVFTVKGTPDLFSKMANVMLSFDKHGEKRAVFVQAEKMPSILNLVWLDGDHLAQPEQMHVETLNGNPQDDIAFVERLPYALSEVKRKLHGLKDAAE